ncbi:hypothetical protein [Sphingomonas mesophila]|uniref:hypothetical protein n=1 Tax=Sphingomonas mesophila TaxID=2303576 RepID=UPI000E58E7A1|nr:hypothetical protein [Sphingomonas mesophila]
MRKVEIEHAAHEIATQVRAVEDIIDQAIAEIAELQVRMVSVRNVAPVGVAAGQPAFEQLGGAVQALIAARGGVANCHGALVEAKQFVPGLRTTGFGDVGECPPKVAHADLRVVA